ncbi:alpha/beta hydrolase family protein [Arenicella xantha]|uniref:Putative dienelactone hydrolase n=1 Tax=Arenicella xantha TaxID=644221 RepID=A0A395JKK8_9GAMM|nr:CocE/NonD family hydrolase [Arenicella xantha]RBP51241.1 putative dienelactone hydrolase [Arenicella xantha]
MKILKIIAKWTLLFWTVVGVVVAGIWWLNAPENFAENSQSEARLNQVDYAVEQLDLKIIDAGRPTPAMAKFKGDDKRTLNGTVWLPKGESSGHPLIVYSHGFGGNQKESSHVTKYLAGIGYVVAAVDFPLSNTRSPAGIPQLLDVVNQPADVRAVIDHVLALNEDPNSELYQRIDSSNIGAMGLSLGGLTTALAAFHPDLMDKRIKAAVMMAPPLEAFSDQFFNRNVEVASLLISGSMDRVVPEPANATQVRDRHPNGWFLSMDKGTHLGFADISNPIRWMDNPDTFGCFFMGMMLPRLDLPERWSAVIPNTGNVLRDVVVNPPCPELPGESMNGLTQQWLTRIAVGSFFDMHLRNGARAESATKFFKVAMSAENPEISLSVPFKR